MTPHEEWERRAAERGYQPSKKKICPRVVAGLQCNARRPGGCGCPEGGYGRGVYDHPRLWQCQVTGELILTSEPYQVDGQDLARFVTQMAELGLDVGVFGDAWWNPGRTIRITVVRAGHGARRWEVAHRGRDGHAASEADHAGGGGAP